MDPNNAQKVIEIMAELAELNNVIAEYNKVMDSKMQLLHNMKQTIYLKPTEKSKKLTEVEINLLANTRSEKIAKLLKDPLINYFQDSLNKLEAHKEVLINTLYAL